MNTGKEGFTITQMAAFTLGSGAFWAAFAALFAWICDATPTNIMAAGAYGFAACCILLPVSFAWSWVVHNVRHFVEVVAGLLLGALVWAHVWLLAHVLLGLEFGLYSAPSIAGWLLVSLWVFLRGFTRHGRVNSKGGFRRLRRAK